MILIINGLDVDPAVVQLFIAAALGMLLGLEREWSNKSAGIRTFTLTSVIGAASVITGEPILVALGGILVLLQGGLLGVRGLISEVVETDTEDVRGLSLTTSTSLLVAYVVGILIGSGEVLLGVVIGISSSFLLVVRRELHGFANRLSRKEVRSAAEFAIIAFVVYPILPSGTYGPWNAIDPKLVWLLVIAVSAIGFVNYAVIQRYGSHGIAITGFFGGLVNSTAVIGGIAGRARENAGIMQVAVGTILMADAAMAMRNLAIVVVFLPASALGVGLPLGFITLGGIALALYGTNWEGEIDLEFDSPFSSQNALKFGTLFLFVLVLTAGAQDFFGKSGFLFSSFLSGLVSSGTTTTTAVTLATTGQISNVTATQGILLGTLSSILVKIGLAASINRSLLSPVVRKSAYLSLIGIIGAALSVQLL